jgi:hypothetical protein
METSDTVGKPYLGVHQTGSRPIFLPRDGFVRVSLYKPPPPELGLGEKLLGEELSLLLVLEDSALTGV